MCQAALSDANPAAASEAETLRACCLIADGNSHRPDLLATARGVAHADLISEALLPQIRTTAMLIAAQRHDFNSRSPQAFSDEADWFAARIIVLRARVFHLDIGLNAMLHTANRRAEAFARKHGLPFTPAKIRPCLHASRPAAMLLCECALPEAPRAADVRHNSLNLGKVLHKMM